MRTAGTALVYLVLSISFAHDAKSQEFDSVVVGSPQIFGNRVSIAGDDSNTEIVTVDSPATQTTDIQTWRVGGRVVADITATGSIELNSVTFGTGRGAVIAELAGGSFFFQSDPSNGNGNFVFNAPSPGRYLFQTGGVTRLSISDNGTIAATKSCASGYIRFGTNFCRIDGINDQIWLGDVCSWLRVPSPDAKAVVYEVESIVMATNETGYKSLDVELFSGGGCSTMQKRITSGAQEFEALSSSRLAINNTSVTIPTRGGAVTGLVISRGEHNVVRYRVEGYYD